jgi:leader peptidase (prepilin peptidase) / N-methyltransferase
LLIAAAAVLGLILGSFATVVAYRVPRRESIVSGRSRCPSCGHTVTASENVPVLSYLLQSGRCRHCDVRIPPRYPLIELSTAILFSLSAWRFGPSPAAALYAAFFWVLVVLTVVDIDHHLLPNRIVFPTLVAGWIGLVALALLDGRGDRLVGAAVGGAIFGGSLLAITFAYEKVTGQEGMGWGDGKLALVLGTFLGYISAPGLVLVGMFLSFLIGSVIGILGMILTERTRKSAIPFGPSLALGTVAAIFVGRPLLDAYLRHF